MTDHETSLLIPTADRERLNLYRTLMGDLRQANEEMALGNYRILKQAAGSDEQQDVTPEAIRTNEVTIVLLQTAIAMEELRRS